MKTVEELEGRLSRISAQLNTLYENKMFANLDLDEDTIDDLINRLGPDYLEILAEDMGYWEELM